MIILIDYQFKGRFRNHFRFRIKMHQSQKDPFLEQLSGITGQDPSRCYQCGKCSAGCPVREFCEDPPNRVVRFVQLGYYEKALSSNTVWMCAGCQTCSSRCPNDFHLAEFMDAMRQIARAEGITPDKKAVAFHDAFLKQVKRYGRMFELGLVVDYKLSSLELTKDIDIAPATLKRGKLGFMPPRIKGKEQVKKIFGGS